MPYILEIILMFVSICMCYIDKYALILALSFSFSFFYIHIHILISFSLSFVLINVCKNYSIKFKFFSNSSIFLPASSS